MPSSSLSTSTTDRHRRDTSTQEEEESQIKKKSNRKRYAEKIDDSKTKNIHMSEVITINFVIYSFNTSLLFEKKNEQVFLLSQSSFKNFI